MKNTLTRVAFAAALLAPLAFAMPAMAATPNWDVTGTYVWDVFGSYFHDITIDVQNANGTFSGTGYWPTSTITPSPSADYTTETVTGFVDGDNINLTVEYLGPYGLGSIWNMTGTIDSGGHISGTVPWNWQLTGEVATDITDIDNDGVLNGDDLCEDTTVDSPWGEGIGQNRWQVMSGNGGLGWYQHNTKKGVTTDTRKYGLDYTYGCNGHQIIEMLDGVMNGHLKFGLSSSVLEEFHFDMMDGELDGVYLVDTVTVPANGATAVSSVNLPSGHDYELRASGTAYACNESGCVI